MKTKPIINNNFTVLTPVILSVSRSTDIPAFYTDWFLKRLHECFCDWINPFNRQVYRVSFEQTRMIVFWSKNPKPMYEHLDELERLGFRNYYFQFTLNDYVREGLEPNVPSIETRIETFKKMAKRIGKARVIWRFDPLLLSPSLSIEDLLDRIDAIGRELNGATEKLVFSFADISEYRKVTHNLRDTGCREFTFEEKMGFVEGLCAINKRLGFKLATCAEDIDLSKYGISHNKCVDDDLMVRLFHDDAVLMDYLGAEYDMIDGWTIRKSKKDKGQRKACGCVVSKDIGMYNTCPHLCRYCYANTTDRQVMTNWERHKSFPSSSSLV